MNISKLKLAWKYITGGMGAVTDYLLDLLNRALDGMPFESKERIQGVLNLAIRICATLAALKWLVPTKWQTAYSEVLNAVDCVCLSLDDLKITAEEYAELRANFCVAISAWKSDDDETCVDYVEAA